MPRAFDKLVALLKELFQIDQPDLDFGFYRVIHAKSAEITQFLENDLLPQVRAAFEQYQPASKAAIEKELAKAIGQAQDLGTVPETAPKVKQLRARLAEEAVDLDALEAEVYDHLYTFFRRYYSDGDFLSKRVYKPGVYAIPYEGEEVKLYWANADQYYIKTSEYLRDYAFRLHPENEKNPMRVHFRLVDAAEGEHGSVKEQAGRERRFKLTMGLFAALEDGELVIRFNYAPDPAKQKELNAAAEAAIFGLADASLAHWVKALAAKHVRADGTASEATRLRIHLDRYTARNTFDYFIHKDLESFLRRELDFYIKNEVMHLDDVESESASRVEQYLSKIKVIRSIAGKIITFLAQLEDFQKKLWLKKKFVVETSYCMRLGAIPEAFYSEIATNEAQREEWVRFYAIDALKEATGSLHERGKPAYRVPLTVEFLKAHSTLMVDTRHFDAPLVARLLATIGNHDDTIDGVVVHADNQQALSLLGSRYRKSVACAYIDPPYNTGNDSFVYKDTYMHSSWLALLQTRLELAEALLADQSAMFISIDGNERDHLRVSTDSTLGRLGYLNTFVWVNNLKGRQISGRGAAGTHEYVLAYGTNGSRSFTTSVDWAKATMPSAYKGFAYDVRTDERGPFVLKNELYNTNSKFNEETRPNLVFNIHYNFGTREVRFSEINSDLEFQGFVKIAPHRNSDGVHRYHAWRWSKDKIVAELYDLEFVGSGDECRIFTKVRGFSETALKDLITDIPTDAGTASLVELFGTSPTVEYPKPVELVHVFVAQADAGANVLDYFAGSGTTGHAVINLNREDGGRRKFILVEQADYFDTVLLPRVKKVTYTPEWKNGKPKRLATSEEAERSPRILKVVRLESYEDTLNNLVLHRTKEQQGLLGLAQAQGADKLREQYMLHYLLDVETRGSQSLLNVAAFTDPTAYTLKVKRPSSDESRDVNVDLLETFNWLIGLTVQHIAAPQTFSADFERDGEGRLRFDGQLEPEASGRWWFRTVAGTTPDGRKTLIVWRTRPGGEANEGIEQDNLVLDEWFAKQGHSSKDSELNLIYVNGGNNLENLRAPDDTWQVRLIEEDFFRLMFETEGV